MRPIRYENIKRVLDILLSIIFLVITFPIIILISIIVTIQFKHLPIYKQKRIGKKGKPFYIYKFQTMVDDSNKIFDNFSNELKTKYYKNYKLENDPRVTKIGSILRKFSLDELPQLINVLKGEMSLVGPRPVVKEELKKYGKNIDKLLSVTPGMTGFWQVNGHNNLTYNKRIKLDMFYIDNISFKLDVLIIMKTFTLFFKRKSEKI